MSQAEQALSGADAINAMFSTDRDRGADHAAPVEQQPQQTEQPAPKAQDAPAADAAPTSDEASPGHMIPKGRFDAEAAKRREAERLNAELQGRLSAYEQHLANFQHQQRQHQPAHPQPQQPQIPAQAPDPVVDPAGFQQWMTATINSRVQEVQLAAHNQFLNLSKSNAASTYGYQTVQAAEQFAAQHNVLGQFASQPDPYGALVQWFNSAQVLNQIGGDFAGYQERLRKEGAERALAELKQGKQPMAANGQPQQQPRFPTTLADQTAAGAQVGSAPLSGNAAISAMFASDRKQRAF